MWPFKKRERLPLLRLEAYYADETFLLMATTWRRCELCGHVEIDVRANPTMEQKFIRHDACPEATFEQSLRALQVAFKSKWRYCLG